MSGSWLGKKWLLACNACVRPNVHDNQQQIGYKESKEEQEKQLIGKKH